MPKLNAQLGELSGLAALRHALSDFQRWNAVLLRDAPLYVAYLLNIAVAIATLDSRQILKP